MDEFYSQEVLPDCPEVVLNIEERVPGPPAGTGVFVNRFGEVAPADSDDSDKERILLG